ncbi:MAG: metallophosphoesterase family protein [Candidatus Nanoarchaeia archaeon]
MKFSHIADVHIGSWRDEKLKELSVDAFISAINTSIEEKVDFILIAGDLFNTALPSIEHVKIVVRKLREAKEKNIMVYFIAGSHDFSPSGKTMLDIIEEANLGINVMKGKVDEMGKLHLTFTNDSKTGAKIVGIMGKKGMLDRKDYEILEKDNLEKEKGFKIFMFHTSIDELKPEYLKEMESYSLNFMPRGFDYYAGGHVHIVEKKDFEGYKNIIYPGPTFPASFSELEKLGCGGFYIYDDGKIERKKIAIKETINVLVSVDNKTVEQAKKKITERINEINANNKIILIRIYGTLSSGKSTDLDFNTLISNLYSQGAYFVMKNTSKLLSKDFNEIQEEQSTPEEIEEKVITSHLNQVANDFADEKEITKKLIRVFSEEKNEAEKNADYENRIHNNANEVLK